VVESEIIDRERSKSMVPLLNMSESARKPRREPYYNGVGHNFGRDAVGLGICTAQPAISEWTRENCDGYWRFEEIDIGIMAVRILLGTHCGARSVWPLQGTRRVIAEGASLP